MQQPKATEQSSVSVSRYAFKYSKPGRGERPVYHCIAVVGWPGCDSLGYTMSGCIAEITTLDMGINAIFNRGFMLHGVCYQYVFRSNLGADWITVALASFIPV